MKHREFPAVEPFWHWGTCAYLSVSDSGDSITVQELVVQEAKQTEGGWMITAGVNSDYVFEVDAKGESADCVPWDDDLEAEYNPRRRGVTITPLEDRIIVPDPPSPLEGVEVWEAFHAAEMGRREGGPQ